MINSLGARAAYQASSQLKPQEVKKEAQISNEKSASSDKVAQISAAIADGTYKIDLSRTAKAIVDVLA